MKKSILLLCLFACIKLTYSQKELPDKYYEWATAFFEKNDAIYNPSTVVPEKWKNESAVILFMHKHYGFYTKKRYHEFFDYERKRIKLQDKAAVTKYSTITYRNFIYGEFDVVVGVRIIKPDGTEQTVDVQANLLYEKKASKLAVPNLEVGDIIDIYFLEIKHPGIFDWSRTTPEEFILNDEYPIVDYKFTLEKTKKFFLSYKSYHGVPALEEVPIDDEKLRKYGFDTTNIAKFKNQRYQYPLVQLPTIKLEATFLGKKKSRKNGYFLIKETENEIKEEVTKEEILDLFTRAFTYRNFSSDTRRRYKDQQKKFEKQPFSLSKIEDIYYFYRHRFKTINTIPILAIEREITTNMAWFEGKFGHPNYFNSKKSFASIMSGVLYYYDIPFELYITANKSQGTIDDLFFPDDIVFLFKTKTDPPMYLQFIDSHTEVNEISPMIEGNMAYVLHPGEKKFESVTIERIPESAPSDNIHHAIYNVTLDDSKTGLIFTNNTHLYTGHEKDYAQDRFLVYSDYVYKDYETSGTWQLPDYYFNKDRREKKIVALEAMKAEFAGIQKETFQKKNKTYFNKEELSDYSYAIDSIGRYNRKTPFVFHDSYTIANNFVKKAGPNLILEIGSIMGNQIKITPEEKERTLDVHKPYPVTYITEAHFKIPDGYEIKDIENLNVSVTNETGSFTATATIANGELVFTATEIHNNYFEPVANWFKFVEILDAAYNYSTEKVLLSRK